MYYVYILRSITHPKQIYIGYTRDLKNRLAQHNSGKSAYTSKFVFQRFERVSDFSKLRVFNDPC